MSAFSRTVIFENSSTSFMPPKKPQVHFPLHHHDSQIVFNQHDNAPTCEEEADLFASTTSPHVRVPGFSPGFNMAHTATHAKSTVTFSPYRYFPQGETSRQPEELFAGTCQICFPTDIKSDRNTRSDLMQEDEYKTPTIEKEMALFLPEVKDQFPLKEINFNGTNAALATRQTISVTSNRPFTEDLGRNEDDYLFESEGRPVVKLYPATRSGCMPEPVIAEVTAEAASQSDEAAPQTATEIKFNPNASVFEPQGQGSIPNLVTNAPTASKINFSPIASVFEPHVQPLTLGLNSNAPTSGSQRSTFSLDADAGIFEPHPKNHNLNSRVDAPDFVPDPNAPKLSTGQLIAALIAGTECFVTANSTVGGYSVGDGEFVGVQGSDDTTFAQDNITTQTFDAVIQQQLEESQWIIESKAHQGTIPAQLLAPEFLEHRRQQVLSSYQPKDSQEPHHFSFLGSAVYTKTATSPATSLAIIIGTPKLKLTSDANSIFLRREALLLNAAPYVDPVVFSGDPQLLSQLQGSELENAVIGSVHKAYGQGAWQKDYHGMDEDVPEFDPLDKDYYDEDDHYFNPSMRLDYITQHRVQELADNIVDEANHKKQQREAFTRTKSNLSEVMSHDYPEKVPVGKEGSPALENETKEVDETSKPASDLSTLERGPDVPMNEDVESTHPSKENDNKSSDIDELDKDNAGTASKASDVQTSLVFTSTSHLGASKDQTSSNEEVAADDEVVSNDELHAALDAAIKQRSPPSADEEISESESEPIHPGDAVSPLKSATLRTQSVDERDPSLEISPLKSRKTSGTSSQSGDIDEDTDADHSTSSSDTSVDDAEEVKAVEGFEKGKVEEPEAQGATQPSEHFGASNDELPIMKIDSKRIPFNLPLRPKPKSSKPGKLMTIGPFDFKDLNFPPFNTADIVKSFNHTLDVQKLVRSPECGSLRTTSQRPWDVYGNDRAIAIRRKPPVLEENSDGDDSFHPNDHTPHQLSPIKEESPNKAFFEDGAARIEEPAEEDTVPAQKYSPVETASPVTPTRRQIKRRTTMGNLGSIAKEQEETSFGQVESPYKRPSAPTPTRMLNGAVFPHIESDSVDTDSLVVEPPSYFDVFGTDPPLGSPKGKERVFEPCSPLVGAFLQDTIVEDDEAESSPSPSPSPHHAFIKKYNERYPSAPCLGQTWDGKDGSPGPAAPDSEGSDTAQTITPEPVSSSAIGIAITPPSLIPTGPSYSSTAVTLVEVQTTTPLGADVSAYLNHNETPEPSPNPPFAALAFESFSGVQGAAMEFGEYNTTAPVATLARAPSQAQADVVERSIGPLLTNHLTSNLTNEDLLPPSPTTTPQPQPKTVVEVSSSPILSQATAFTSSTSRSSSIPSHPINEVKATAADYAAIPARTARDVLFTSIRRSKGSGTGIACPSLRSSSWGRVERKLVKKRVGASAAAVVVDGDASGVKKEVKKGRFGKWIGKTFGFSKGKGKGKGTDGFVE